MNVKKTLIALEKDQDAIKVKYGKRFKYFYDKTINSIIRSDRALIALENKRQTEIVLSDELIAALAITETEV